MKVYISGPIDTDIPGTTLGERKLRFNLCEQWINERGPVDWEPVNPLKVEPCLAPDAIKCELGLEDINTHTWECYLRYDLMAMLQCEAIVFLPGWGESRGATFEYDVAKRLGFKAYFAEEDGRILL